MSTPIGLWGAEMHQIKSQTRAWLREWSARRARWDSRRILKQDLLAAHTRDDVVSELPPFRPQRCHGRGEIDDLEGEAIPTSGLGDPAIRHDLGASPGTAGVTPGAAQDAKVAPGEHGEGGSRMHLLHETEMMANRTRSPRRHRQRCSGH